MSERQRHGARSARRDHIKPTGWSVKRDELGNAVLNWAVRETDNGSEHTDNLLKRLDSSELTLADEVADTDFTNPYDRSPLPRGRRKRRR